MLRMVRPAPASSTTARAISAITSDEAARRAPGRHRAVPLDDGAAVARASGRGRRRALKQQRRGGGGRDARTAPRASRRRPCSRPGTREPRPAGAPPAWARRSTPSRGRRRHRRAPGTSPSASTCAARRRAAGAEGEAHGQLAAGVRAPARAAGCRRWRTRSAARSRPRTSRSSSGRCVSPTSASRRDRASYRVPVFWSGNSRSSCRDSAAISACASADRPSVAQPAQSVDPAGLCAAAGAAAGSGLRHDQIGRRHARRRGNRRGSTPTTIVASRRAESSASTARASEPSCVRQNSWLTSTDRRRAFPRVAVLQQPSQRWPDAQQAQGIRGHDGALHAQRLAGAEERGLVAAEAGQRLERPLPSAEVDEVADRDIGLGQPGARVAVPQHDQPIGVGERQRPQQGRVDDREQGGVGADAQGEGQDGGRGKSRFAPEDAQRLSELEDRHAAWTMPPRAAGAGLDEPAVTQREWAPVRGERSSRAGPAGAS